MTDVSTRDDMSTHADLAKMLKLPLATTVELRKRENWPHHRFGRHVRFTPDQVAEIVATHAVKAESASEEPAVLGGVTKRSASRRAS